jgi:hypothetical protein
MQSSIVLDLLSDRSIALNDNLIEALGRLDRVGLLVQPLKFLKSTALGLNTIA